MRRLLIRPPPPGGGPPVAGGAFRVGLLVVLTLMAGAAPLSAQTNLETNAGIQFNFSAPGAANLALGGAFIGLAFDGTAAYTNPAGLTTIVDPEAWFEVRGWSYTHVFTDGGRIPGQEPTGEGLDTIAGLRSAEATDHLFGPSFVSYVKPWRDWSFAVYAHKLLDFEANFSTRGAYLERIRSRNPQGLGILGERSGRLPALRNRMEVGIDSYGAAAAYRLTPRLSLGAAVVYHDFRIDSVAERFVPDLFDPPRFDEPSRVVNEQLQQGRDGDWGFLAGALWQDRHRTWSLGAVYRQGPEFRFRAVSRRGPGSELPFPTVRRRAVFHVPDVYAVGVAWRPTDRLTLALDYDRVEYSDLMDDFTDIFDLASLFPEGDPELDRFHIDDVGEIHLGVELWFPRPFRAYSLRFGAWYDPDHGLRFEGENPSFRAVFRGGSDEVHGTVGVGVTTHGYQLDVAADVSDRFSVLSVSIGRRF